MIKVYILPVERLDNTDTVVGIEYIHDALLTYNVEQATLIQDTFPNEDAALSLLAIEVRDPTSEEIARFEAIEPTLPPTADEIRLKEICDIGNSAIPIPVLAEGFKLLCKRLGFL